MKKTLTLLAIMAAIGPAWAADVVSSNVVGYNRVTLASGYSLLGSQFLLVGGQTADMSQLMSSVSLTGMDVDSGTFNSELMLWNGVGYDTYGWSGNVGDPDYDNKWLDEGTWAAVSLTAPVGQGFWISSTDSGSITLSGEVSSAEEISKMIGAGYSLVANPYPAAISIQSIQPVGISGMNVDSGTFYSEILLWNGVGYDTYGWSGNVGDPDYDNKWLDEGTWAPASATLEVGQGCWIKSDAQATITFSK